jgi:hypothetical protein
MIDPNPNDNVTPRPDRAMPAEATTPEELNRPRSLGRGPTGSGAGSIDSAGTAGGGTEVGGLAGTNIGDGAPANADLDEATDDAIPTNERENDAAGPPYAGVSGGAVGGAPAEKRSKGGRTHRGFTPSGVHRGDSTIGTNPRSGTD